MTTAWIAFLTSVSSRCSVQKHPWIFKGSIGKIIASPATKPNTLVDITDSNGKWVARGFHNAKSPSISARILTWDKEEATITNSNAGLISLLSQRLKRSINLRRKLYRSSSIESNKTDSYRLVFSESDGLPGLVADKFNSVAVMSFTTAAMAEYSAPLSRVLYQELKDEIDAVYEKADATATGKEGLSRSDGFLISKPGNNSPISDQIITENGVKLHTSISSGQKTGAFLDQKDNRLKVLRHLSSTPAADVLSVFSYTGGFESYFQKANAARSIVSIDSSLAALQSAAKNVALNSNSPSKIGEIIPLDKFRDIQQLPSSSSSSNHICIHGDAFAGMKRLKELNSSFDCVILDPPKFAPSVHDVDAACRAYKDVNLRGLQLVKPGGLLATFSCSGAISLDLFQKIIFGACLDAGRDAQIVEVCTQPADHPVSIYFPESAYLKGFILRLLN